MSTSCSESRLSVTFPGNKRHLIGSNQEHRVLQNSTVSGIKALLKLPFKPNFQEKLTFKKNKNC